MRKDLKNLFVSSFVVPFLFLLTNSAGAATLVVHPEQADIRSIFQTFSLPQPAMAKSESALKFNAGMELQDGAIAFAPLSPERAMELGIEPSAAAAFFAEIDRINLLQREAQEFSMEERSSAAFQAIVKASLSADAYAAVHKVLLSAVSSK